MFLTKLPIINDESVYLDWGYRATHVPGMLYYSLYDSKQPLMIWLFGIFGAIFSDPLVAGRLVSLLFGLATTIGIFMVARQILPKGLALFCSLLYITIPIFTLFDRLSLMESGIGSVGVWTYYFLTKLIKEEITKWAIILGIILGIGFFIKTTAILFYIAVAIVLIWKSYSSKKSQYLKSLLIVTLNLAATSILLLINPMFWATLHTNSRYVFTINELLSFPVASWLFNITSVFEIGFVFLTPIVFITFIGGIILLVKNGKYPLVLFLLIPIFLNILTVKSPSQRYLVSLLPLAVVISTYCVVTLIKTKKTLLYCLLGVTIVIPALVSLVLIYSPYAYYSSAKQITRFSDTSNIEGHLSGYGVLEAVEYLEKIREKRPILVSYAENTGNPESAIIVYLQAKNWPHAYMESRYFGAQLTGRECVQLRTKEDVYFVSRNEQQAGLNSVLEKVIEFRKPNKIDSIGIYKMKSECKDPLIVDLNFNE